MAKKRLKKRVKRSTMKPRIDPTIVGLIRTTESFYQMHNRNPRAIWMSLNSRGNYVTAVINDRRYVNTMRFDNGMEAIEFSNPIAGDGKSVALLISRGIPDNTFVATDSVEPPAIVVGTI